MLEKLPYLHLDILLLCDQLLKIIVFQEFKIIRFVHSDLDTLAALDP